MIKIKVLGGILLVGVLAVGTSRGGRVLAAPQPNLPEVKVPSSSMPAGVEQWLRTLKPHAKVQDETFNYLAERCGKRLTAPEYPRDRLMEWSYRQFTTVRDGQEVSVEDPKLLYPAIYRSLLIARDLLGNSKATQRRRGMSLAEAVCARALVTLNDTRLAVQIKDGWLLPFLADAHDDDTHEISRYNVLREGVIVYLQHGDVERYGRGLEVLQVLVEDLYTRAPQTWDNSADWVHIKLGEFYQGQKRYVDAIAQFKAIRTSSMDAAKRLIPELERLASEADRSKDGKETSVSTTSPLPSSTSLQPSSGA